MGFLGKLFGNSADRERDAKFREFGAESADQDAIAFERFQKAAWLISRGNAMGSAGRMDGAIRDFTEAIAIDPSHLARIIHER